MRLHTRLFRFDVAEAAGYVSTVTVARLSEHNSRTHERAYDVVLAGSGNTGGQWGSYDDKTATWDEWGIFLGELYRRDPAMRCGSSRRAPVYANADHFVWATGGRYDELFTVAGQHLRHRWEHNGEAVTGVYSVQECQCGAIRRWANSPWWLAEHFGTPAPVPTQRERLESLTANVAQLRREIDAEYPYDPAKDRAEIARVEAEDQRILAGVRS